MCNCVCVCVSVTPLSCFFPRDQWWFSLSIRTSRAAVCSCGCRGLQGPEESVGWDVWPFGTWSLQNRLCSLEKGGRLKVQWGWVRGVTMPVGGFLLCHGGLHRTLGPLSLVSPTAFQVDLLPPWRGLGSQAPSVLAICVERAAACWRELVLVGRACPQSPCGSSGCSLVIEPVFLCLPSCFQQWICEVLGFGKVGRRPVSCAKEKRFLPVSPPACF